MKKADQQAKTTTAIETPECQLLTTASVILQYTTKET